MPQNHLHTNRRPADQSIPSTTALHAPCWCRAKLGAPRHVRPPGRAAFTSTADSLVLVLPKKRSVGNQWLTRRMQSSVQCKQPPKMQACNTASFPRAVQSTCLPAWHQAQPINNLKLLLCIVWLKACSPLRQRVTPVTQSTTSALCPACTLLLNETCRWWRGDTKGTVVKTQGTKPCPAMH